MGLWLSDRNRLVFLLTACALLSSVEFLVPLFRFRQGRIRRALPNLLLAAAVVLMNLTVASVAASVSAMVTRHGIGLFAGMHLQRWIVLIAGIAGLDLFAWFAHVLLHKVPVGWTFHRVHHSELEVDVTTSFRQHPCETLWRIIWQWAGVAAFGLPFWILPVYLGLSSLNALFEHANVRMSSGVDRCLRLIIVTPHMHKIHHSRICAQTDSNYSNIFSFWDRLFRTYTQQVDMRSLRYGLDGLDDAEGQKLTWLLLEPFRSPE